MASHVEERMYHQILFFYAEIWIRAYCKMIAECMVTQLLNLKLKNQATLVRMERHYVEHIGKARLKCIQKAEERVAELRQHADSHNMLVDLYNCYLCACRPVVVLSSSMPHEVQKGLTRFFKVVAGSLLVQDASLEASYELWLKYPCPTTTDPVTQFTALVYQEASKRMLAAVNTKDHEKWLDHACVGHLIAMVHQSVHVDDKARRKICSYLQRGLYELPVLSFFECEEVGCRACQAYESFLRSRSTSGSQGCIPYN